MASGLVIFFHPDMCASLVDTCREHEQEAVSLPLCLFPPALLLLFSLTDERCQMTRLNGEGRREAVDPEYPSNMTFTNIRMFICEHFKDLECYMECTNTFPYICLCLLGLCLSLLGSVSLSVLLLSVAVVVCAVWLVALCGICTWCQRKLVSYGT